jgi:hypothetical protein
MQIISFRGPGEAAMAFKECITKGVDQRRLLFHREDAPFAGHALERLLATIAEAQAQRPA